MKKKKKSGGTKTLFRLLRYLAGKKYLVALVMLTLTLSTVFDVISPKVIQKITDTIQIEEGVHIDMQQIGLLLLILTACYVISALTLYVARWLL